MLRVVRSDGSYVDLERAVSSRKVYEELICYDAEGEVVARYESRTVIAYGPPEFLPVDKEEPAAPRRRRRRWQSTP
jgi:hypothetical protein